MIPKGTHKISETKKKMKIDRNDRKREREKEKQKSKSRTTRLAGRLPFEIKTNGGRNEKC